jgi:hypothetical protein
MSVELIKPDSGDRRTQKVSKDQNQSQSHKGRYQRLKLLGLCVMCETTPVEGRSYCIACSSKQVIASAKHGARKMLAKHGIKDAAIARSAIAQLHFIRPDIQAVLEQLVAFLADIEAR